VVCSLVKIPVPKFFEIWRKGGEWGRASGLRIAQASVAGAEEARSSAWNVASCRLAHAARSTSPGMLRVIYLSEYMRDNQPLMLNPGSEDAAGEETP
jgi:hypothetical protein